MSNKKKNSFRTFSFIFLSLLVVILPAFLFAVTHQQHTNQFASGNTASVIVNPSATSYKIPPRFIGLSIEMATVCTFLSVESQYPALDQLFKNFGKGVFRFGGSSVENAVWSPTGTTNCSWTSITVTQSLIDSVFSVAKKLGWIVLWDENFKNSTPANYANQALYVSGKGSLLEAFEIGNEPDLYGWSYSTFQSNWVSFYKAAKAAASTVHISGPTTCCHDTTWFQNFMNAEGSKVSLSTMHIYPLYAPNNPTISDLLSANTMNSIVSEIDSLVTSANKSSKQFALSETNAIAGNPPDSLGNSLAEALWGADYMFYAVEHGVKQMNFHGNYPPDGTSPINADATPRALYYGMLFFHYAADNGTVIPSAISSSLNITAHSVLGSDGKLRVALINKDQTNSATVTINTTKSYTSAFALRLSAASASSTTGITFGGSQVASNGTWTPSTSENITVSGNSSAISLPAASAAVITYQ